MPARAVRRHHRARMVARARRMYDQWGLEGDELDRCAVRRADNMAWCACSRCGSPRRRHGRNAGSWCWGEVRTRQEILADMALREWEAER